MPENDLEELIARFVTAIELAAATAQTLQAVTPPLSRISSRIETLDPLLTQHRTEIEKLAEHLPALAEELTSAATHLRNSLRPPVARIWSTASILVLASCILLIVSLTILRPQWCLTEPLQDQLQIGRLLEERSSLLPEKRQRELSSLLQELSTLTSSRASSTPSEKEGPRSGSVSPAGR